MQVTLDYPVHPRPRYGHGLPSHARLAEIIGRNADRYATRVEEIVALAPSLLRFAADEAAAGPTQPAWVNPWFAGLDTASLYSLLVTGDPAHYIEVGSGTSTKVARRAIEDHGLRTRIISVDPQPRAEIDAICDEVVRSPLEDADLSVFDRAGAGDLVFIDNSHRVFTNSDATVVFLEVMPRLAPDVLIGIHDIFLPDDYPPEWNDRFYSEQYVLAGMLIAGLANAEIDFPAWHVACDPALSTRLAALFDAVDAPVQRHGNAFWMRTRAA